MAAKPGIKPDDDPKPKADDQPDGRGPRPTDPNELAKWIVDQTTDEPSYDEDHSADKP